MTTATATAFNPNLFDIDGTFYAVPESRLRNGEVILPLDVRNRSIVPDDFVELSRDWDEAYRAMALRMFLNDWTSHIIDFGRSEVRIGQDHYVVGTDGEMDDRQLDYLRSMIDEADMPDWLRSYIDEERFIDHMKMDPRAQHLARKDSIENTQEVEGTTYYIYRI